MPRKPKKRAIRPRHTGRLELHGQTFIARWMEGGERHTESTGIRLADFGGDEAKARAAAKVVRVQEQLSCTRFFCPQTLGAAVVHTGIFGNV